ncbi:unnamed protein product [Miscanthus lutarioriparius]|uniref:Uncharacterized protein n=1 Tax=Miscanthus lutarioriparius TaxID=422564 RepID=A0A811QZ76_9POAL|nr:unnamed protein product [Miscanthus lutarioriparius]
MQLLLYGMIKQRPFQIGWYMDMATKYPVNFLFVATTSRLFQDVSEERLGPQLIQKLKKEGVNPKQWRLRNFQCMLCPQVRMHAIRTAHENIDMTIKAADSILSQFDLARRIQGGGALIRVCSCFGLRSVRLIVYTDEDANCALDGMPELLPDQDPAEIRTR